MNVQELMSALEDIYARAHPHSDYPLTISKWEKLDVYIDCPLRDPLTKVTFDGASQSVTLS